MCATGPLIRRRHMLRLCLSAVFALTVAQSMAGPATAAPALTPLPGQYFERSASSFDGESLALGPKDEEGSLWAVDSGAGAIERMSANGILTGKFVVPVGAEPEEPEFSFPLGIAAGPDSDMWFTDAGTNSAHDAFIGSITPLGQITEYALPSEGTVDQIVAGPNEEMWFTGFTFTSTEREAFIGSINHGGVITKHPVPVGDEPVLPFSQEPKAIAVGADGNLWFTDGTDVTSDKPFVGKLAPSGRVTQYTIPQGNDLLFTSHAMVLGPDDNIWFTVNSEALASVTPSGQISEYPLPELELDRYFFSEPINSLAVGNDGNLWFPCGTDCFGRATTAGVVTLFSVDGLGEANVKAVAADTEGDLWFTTENGLIRITPPPRPEAVSTPEVSGDAVVGGTLSVSEGSWANDVTRKAIQWESCDESAQNCEPVSGATSNSIALRSTDVNHTLRALVTADGLGGVTSVLSSSSAVVTPLRSASSVFTGLLSTVPAEPRRRSQEIGATMAWRFLRARNFVVVKELMVVGLQAGSEVGLLCGGRGCPFMRHAVKITNAHGSGGSSLCKSSKCAGTKLVTGHVNLAGVFRGRHLRPGSYISVVVEKPGWIGKSFRFQMRASAPPKVKIGCVAAGAHSALVDC
jgi:streptogramin lyase